MASSQAVPVDFQSADIHFLRSMKIFEEVKIFMRLVFREGTKDRLPSESLLEYFKRKGIALGQFKKKLNKHQTDLINNFPDGSSFDITLLFLCIQWGCNGVADKNNDVWKEGNNSLEAHLTELKNWNNQLYHERPQYDEKEFFDQTEKIRTLLTQGLQKADIVYGINDVDSMITEMNDRIKKLRDQSWLIMDFEEFKKTTLYSAKVNHIKIEGKVCLFDLYIGWIIICPLSLLCKVNFKVEEIYTELILKGEESPRQKNVQRLEDLLEGIDHKKSDPIILLEGHAGSGKSTITKKFLSEWSDGQNSTIKKLSDYDLLLYTEFRKQSIKSFKDLVTHLMPEIASSFFLEDLCNIIQNMKTLVILDGLDEMNDSSSSLFNEILELKATKGISVMVTTRPESLQTYYGLAHRNHIKTKHIMISGIAEEKRQEFVQKYYKEMEKEGDTHEDISGLLHYLKRTAKPLSHLWQLPYNLTLLVCLWVYKSKAVNSITTSSELYWEIYELYKSKLSDRLLLHEKTKAWEKSLKKKIIEKFVVLLGQFALKCQKNDMIELSKEDFRELREHCIDEGLPTDEMLGAFLKPTPLKTTYGYETTYSFPHKSLQDFLAAVHICVSAEDKTRILKMGTVLDYTSSNTSRGSTEITIVRSMLSNASGSSVFDIKKFQNVLVTLIGLFYLRRSNVTDSIKIEVLDLIKETGVTDKYKWLEILDSVKCDETVANFISEQHDTFKGVININDSNIYAFNTLLDSVTSPISNPDEVIVNIKVSEETLVMTTLLNSIIEKKMRLKTLIMEHDFKNPGVHSASVDVIALVMQRYQLSEYKGSFHQILQETQHIDKLNVLINRTEDYEALLNHLNKHKPRLFEICLSSDMETHSLKSLPQGLGPHGLRCYVCEVRFHNMENSAEILSKIQPKEGFFRVYFPRCFLKEKQHLVSLLETLEKQHIRIKEDLIFPESLRPSSEEQQQIDEEAQTKLGCSVNWNSDLNAW